MSAGAPDHRSAEAALQALGIRCSVETRARLAILIPAPGETVLHDAGVRRAALAALQAQGYTHAAVELVAEQPHDGGPESVAAAPHV